MTYSPPRDDAADASQFLSRLAYAILALGAPVGVVLHEFAIYLLFPIGVALLIFSALLDPPGNVVERLRTGFSSPTPIIALCFLAWAALSILWTPFAVAAGQRLLDFSVWAIAVALALALTRAHARATDLYLFPVGLLFTMAAMLSAWIALRQGAEIAFARIEEGGVALIVLLFPTMAGLAARARLGYARLLMILAFVYVFSVGSAPGMIAMFAGLTAMSFALSDIKRTTRDLALFAAGVIALAPLIVLVAAPLARLVMHAKLPTLPPPYPSLAYAFNVVQHDWARLITGHGFETLARGIRFGALPPEAPRTALFQIWYELGVVGGVADGGGRLVCVSRDRFLPPAVSPLFDRRACV